MSHPLSATAVRTSIAVITRASAYTDRAVAKARIAGTSKTRPPITKLHGVYHSAVGIPRGSGSGEPAARPVGDCPE
ncbi:MAG: hypothetical protein ACREX8_02340, partial [Gammaproteobacteria bacterium]